MLLGDQNKIHFALGVHNHQPIGNWDRVIEDTFQHAYLPFIDVLERHPEVKVTIHYGGHLLTWLAEHHPEFIARIRQLVANGQIELLTGAFYEPVLAIIPDEDKIGQIQALSATLRQVTEVEPTGHWLTGRAWEPQLAKPIAEAGCQYTIVDETHFIAAGLRGAEIWGYYETEEQGEAIAVFPNQRELRTMVPFQPPEKVIELLRQHATPDGARIGLCFDDGEKFGSWPNTYQAVYIEGWLDRFFTLLEQNKDWITTCTVGEYLERHRPWGRLYLPTCAPLETQEWALPPEQGLLFEEARGEVEPRFRDFLRGGYWRHFLIRYPEANNLHKKMLRVSRLLKEAAKLAAVADVAERVGAAGSAAPLPESPADALEAARRALWRGQSNDPYWHGVFGGIYLNHLRAANYQALLQAEAICDRLRHGEQPFLTFELTDFDRDGAPEALISNREQNLYFTPTYGGALFEHDFKPRAYNLLDTLARRPEAYHAKIARASHARELAAQPPAAIGERSVTKESGLERFLHYDWYRRLSLLDHFFHPDTRLETFQNMSYGEQGDFVNQPYALTTRETPDGVWLRLTRDGHIWVGPEFWPVRVTKEIHAPAAGAGFTVDYTVTNLWDRPLDIWFGVEFNVNMRSGTGVERKYYSSTGRSIEPCHIGSIAAEDEVRELGVKDENLGVDWHLAWSEPAILWRFPVETVSRSEGGFERVYQSSVIVPNWRLSLPASGSWSCRFTQQVSE